MVQKPSGPLRHRSGPTYLLPQSFLQTLCVRVLRFAQDQLDRHAALAADEGHGYGVAGLMLFHDGIDVLGIGDLLAVDGNNQVAASTICVLPT